MANPKIQLRHDTSTNWQTQNPVLLEGEVAIETDSNKVKIGNGTDNYNTLPYITDQTKIDLDYSNADYQPVNKSGDTMTGLLNINSAAGYYSGLQLQHPDYETGSIPANNLHSPYLKFVDKNERQLTEMYHTIRTTGESNFVINSKSISDSGSDKYIVMSQKKDGSFTFTFPNTTCCDGQWVSKYQEAIGGTAQTINASASKTITFTELPAKQCEIIFTITQSTDIDLAVWSNLLPNGSVNRALKKGCTTIILPVGSDKIVKIGNLSPTTAASITLVRLMGYRIIGTNTNN